MKQYIHKTSLLLLAIVLFTMGLGANVFKYCCTDCESNITLISDLGCCSMHEYPNAGLDPMPIPSCCEDNEVVMKGHNHQMADMADGGLCVTDEASHCSVSRVSIDLNMPTDRQVLASPMVWISDFLPILLNIRSQLSEVVSFYKYVDDSPDINPRTYLSLIQVLII